jgi:hypothetical protein
LISWNVLKKITLNGLMVLSILINSSLQGLVYCVGSDGHRALEDDDVGMCRQSTKSKTCVPAETRNASIDDTCPAGSICKDIHFTLESFLRNGHHRPEYHTLQKIAIEFSQVTPFVSSGRSFVNRICADHPALSSAGNIASPLRC